MLFVPIQTAQLVPICLMCWQIMITAITECITSINFSYSGTHCCSCSVWLAHLQRLAAEGCYVFTPFMARCLYQSSELAPVMPMSWLSWLPSVLNLKRCNLEGLTLNSVFMRCCCSWRTAAVLVAAATIFFTAVSFTAEPLLACVMAGLVTTNRRY